MPGKFQHILISGTELLRNYFKLRHTAVAPDPFPVFLGRDNFSLKANF
jgi:hypothetical protein